MSKVDVEKSISKFEAYINDVLKEDLIKLEFRLQNVNAELTDLYQQKEFLRVMCDKNTNPDGFKSQINIGCNFFMEASVTDTSKLLMNIGLNHFLEFSLEEANKYLDCRIKAFTLKAEELVDKSAETKAHIKQMLIGIGELQSTTNLISNYVRFK